MPLGLRWAQYNKFVGGGCEKYTLDVCNVYYVKLLVQYRRQSGSRCDPFHIGGMLGGALE